MDKCARTWLLSSSDHGGDGWGSHAENRDPNSNGKGNVGYLAAMKRIMRRKCAMAQDARREMGSSSSSSTSGDATTTSQHGPPTTSPSSSDRGRGGGDDDCWAMMGNHMEEETTMDREEEGNSAFSIRHRR